MINTAEMQIVPDLPKIWLKQLVHITLQYTVLTAVYLSEKQHSSKMNL